MVESIEELRRICLKKNDPFYQSELPSWKKEATLYLTRLFLYTPISANQTTLLAILLVVISGIFFMLGGCWNWIVGSLLFELCTLLDYVDGLIARYRKQSSIRGAYLDDLTNYIRSPLIFLSMSLGIFHDYSNIWIIISGFSLCLSSTLSKAASDIWLKTIALKGTGTRKEQFFSNRWSKLKISKSKKKILYRIARMFTASTIISLLLLATLLDALLPNLITPFPKFSFRVLLFAFYGITLPIISIIKIASIFIRGNVLGLRSFLID